MTAVDIGVVRGDSLVFEVTFTRNDVAWTDVEDYEPVCQFRARPDSAVIAATPAISFASNVATFALTDDEVTDLAAISETHVWDVQFTDPDADPGYGTFTWPGAGEARNTLAITADATRPEAP